RGSRSGSRSTSVTLCPRSRSASATALPKNPPPTTTDPGPEPALAMAVPRIRARLRSWTREGDEEITPGVVAICAQGRQRGGRDVGRPPPAGDLGDRGRQAVAG